MYVYIFLQSFGYSVLLAYKPAAAVLAANWRLGLKPTFWTNWKTKPVKRVLIVLYIACAFLQVNFCNCIRIVCERF